MRRFLRGLLIVVIAFVAVVVIAGFSYAGALRKAADKTVIAPLNLSGVADGTYTGSAVIMHVKPQVSVTVAGGRIASITSSASVAGNIEPMVNRIIAAQSLDVDGISGATITTKAVKAAVSDAVTP
jgi:uncharacterized protein with FMN-binding domain